MTAVQGTAVDIPTEDGTADAYLTHPADGRAHPGVVVYMDAFGLRPQMRSVADRLAGEGYTVLVPNVFYRHGRAPVMEVPDFIDGSVRPELFQQIRSMAGELTRERVRQDADAYLRALADSPATSDGPVGLTGYCLGARLSLLTAADHPDRVAAAAGFHGGFLATEAPDSPHLAVGSVTAEVYFGHADNDPALPVEQQERLAQALKDAGVRHTCELYEGAHHGFTQADTAAYDTTSAERHWTAMLGLFDRNL